MVSPVRNDKEMYGKMALPNIVNMVYIIFTDLLERCGYACKYGISYIFPFVL